MPAVEPVLRALHILDSLNRHSSASLAELSDEAGLPKPTVSRLLATLEQGGYVQRLPRRGGYVLRERVLRLSAGFRHTDEVVEASRPFLSSLTAEHKWPVGIATLDRDAMRVRFSTGHESPFAIDENFVNRRVPMLLSALGRAYVAFCPSDERETILAQLRVSTRSTDRLARDPRGVTRLLQSIRRAGYAATVSVPGAPAQGLAVPIQRKDRVLATITVRYIGSALTEREAVRRYLASMRRAAEAIAIASGPSAV
jgi:IclR family mhp operon transcriptional activator